MKWLEKVAANFLNKRGYVVYFDDRKHKKTKLEKLTEKQA